MGEPSSGESGFCQLRRGQHILGLDAARLRFQGRGHQALKLQFGPLHRRAAFGQPGVFDEGALRRCPRGGPRGGLLEEHPDIVQPFLDASAIGWYHYLYGDNAKANEAIKHDNPEMTDEQIAYTIGKLKEYGIVDSGDTLTKGIGAMTDAKG